MASRNRPSPLPPPKSDTIVRQRSRRPRLEDDGTPVAPPNLSPSLQGGASAQPESATGLDYEVGNCKPPLHTRWKKGQSGNPKGREKGSKNLKTLDLEEGNAPMDIIVNGKRRRKTRRQVTVMNMWINAAKGQPKAIDLALIKLGSRFEEADEVSDARAADGSGHTVAERDREILDFHDRLAVERAKIVQESPRRADNDNDPASAAAKPPRAAITETAKPEPKAEPKAETVLPLRVINDD
jgi:Family of unknown function (DUF5681)